MNLLWGERGSKSAIVVQIKTVWPGSLQALWKLKCLQEGNETLPQRMQLPLTCAMRQSVRELIECYRIPCMCVESWMFLFAIISTTYSSCCYFPVISYLLSTVMLDPVDIPVITWLQFPFHFHVFTFTVIAGTSLSLKGFGRGKTCRVHFWSWAGSWLWGVFCLPFQIRATLILVSSIYSTGVLIQILLQFCILSFTHILDWGGHVRL